VLDQVGPISTCHRRCRPRRRGRRGAGIHRTAAGAPLDIDRHRRTGGDLEARTSSEAPERIPNPRVRVLERPPSPSPIHRPIGRWNPQTRPPLREVVGNHLAPSMVGARAPTWLHQGGRCCHHRVRGRGQKGSPLPRKKKRTSSKSSRCLIPH
jgi:hypothetical protein